VGPRRRGEETEVVAKEHQRIEAGEFVTQPLQRLTPDVSHPAQSRGAHGERRSVQTDDVNVAALQFQRHTPGATTYVKHQSAKEA
jgi:hypothetical protein